MRKAFEELPVGRTVAAHWAKQDPVVLAASEMVLRIYGANPWVFAADARHFWQFAGAAEIEAYLAMTPEQFAALCGDWEDQDHHPETFGYTWPS